MKHLKSISVVFLVLSDMLLASESKLANTANPVIAQGKTYEKCMWLSPGDKLHYEFTSSASLRFNIHYHEDKKVFYPVPVKLTSAENATFEPETRKYFCLMWNNPVKESARLELSYRINGNNKKTGSE